MPHALSSFITSQGDTAPKPEVVARRYTSSFITSQGDTAPKLHDYRKANLKVSLPVRVTLLQN